MFWMNWEEVKLSIYIAEKKLKCFVFPFFLSFFLLFRPLQTQTVKTPSSGTAGPVNIRALIILSNRALATLKTLLFGWKWESVRHHSLFVWKESEVLSRFYLLLIRRLSSVNKSSKTPERMWRRKLSRYSRCRVLHIYIFFFMRLPYLIRRLIRPTSWISMTPFSN